MPNAIQVHVYDDKQSAYISKTRDNAMSIDHGLCAPVGENIKALQGSKFHRMYLLIG